MSFVLTDVHEFQRHAQYLVHQFKNGPTICMACFLHSVADPAQLGSKKLFVIREFMALFGLDGPEGSQPLHDLLSQHAQLLVSGLLTALPTTQDLGLSQALQDASLLLCSCAYEFLPELFTERVLELLLQLPWPANAASFDLSSTQSATVQSTAAIASCLALLQQLIGTYDSAVQLLASALRNSQELVALMTAGLMCGVEAIVLPLLEVFSLLTRNNHTAIAAAAVRTSQVTPACLSPFLVQQLFEGLLQLLPALLVGEVKGTVLQLLLKLAETGCVIDAPLPPLTTAATLLHNNNQAAYLTSQAMPVSQQQQLQQQQCSFSSTLMVATKPILLDTDPQLQILGCRLLAAIAAQAPAALLQQLIELDCCEHLFEVLRGTLGSCSTRVGLAAAALHEQRRGLTCSNTAAAAEVEVAAESLQAAAIDGLRCFASQGPAFMQHFHFGVDTLTELLLHCTATCNTPTLAATLLLMTGTTEPANPGSLLVPMASIARLAASAVAVLPDSGHAAGSAAAADVNMGQEQQQQQGMALQPSSELQTAYESACSLLTNIAMKWGSSSNNWGLLQQHVLAGSHTALSALSMLSCRSLAEGFLVAACRLSGVTVQILSDILTSSSGNTQQQQQQEGSGAVAGGVTGVSKVVDSQQPQQRGLRQGRKKHSDGSTKAVAAAVTDEKPFAKRRQQQQQQQNKLGTATGPTSLGATQAAVDDLLSLLESALKHLVPAALKVLGAAAGQLQAGRAAASQQQQELELFVNILDAVSQLLLALLTCGGSSAELSSYLPAFARHMLSPPHLYASSMWSILEAVQVPAAAAADVWHVLLVAAVLLEGDCFMTGGTVTNTSTLAASLSDKCSSSRLALLELLCTGPAPATNQAAAAAAAVHSQQQLQQHRHTHRGSSSSSSTSADIRRFCGISEVHKAALCIAAAVLRCGDACWSWGDVLTALNHAVGNAGPGILSQPELLIQTVLLYCQAERQLADELAQQAVQQDDIIFADVQQQQQQGSRLDSTLPPAAVAAAAAGLPVPVCIIHAIEKLGRSMPGHLSPDHGAVQWMLARAVQLPGAVQWLLQRWLRELLPGRTTTTTPAAAEKLAVAAAGEAVNAKQQQQQGCAALAAVLLSHPGAVQQAFQLAERCCENKQQQAELAAWLCVFATVLYQSSSSSSNASSSRDYLFHVGSGGSINSSNLLLLLLGDSGVMKLCRKCMLAAAGSVNSSWISCYTVLCCNACVLAAVVAAAAAQNDGDLPGIDAALVQQLQLQSLQQGTQQVHMAATCIQQLPEGHPLQQQLCMSTANVANALLHIGIMQQQDAAPLQLLAECHEMNQQIARMAAAAVHASSSSSAPAVQAHHQQQLAMQTAAERDVEQLVAATYTHMGLTSSRSSSSVSTAAAAPLLGVVSAEHQFAAALQWHQHQQVMALAGMLRGSYTTLQQQQHTSSISGAATAVADEVNGGIELPIERAFRGHCLQQRQYSNAAAAAATPHAQPVQQDAASEANLQQTVYGLSAAQLLLLVQGHRDGVLQLLLIDSVRLLLLRLAATTCDSSSNSSSSITVLWRQRQWGQLLAMLQNAAAAASNSSGIYREAVTSCLAALYAAAAASQSTHAADAAANAVVYTVAHSPWNTDVMKGVLHRMCKQTAALHVLAQQRRQAALLAATSAALEQASDSICNTSVTNAAQLCSWLLDSEVQQQGQAWCVDAQLLLHYIGIINAAAAAGHTSDNGGSGNRQNSSEQLCLLQLQQLLQPFLEQQQLVHFLCWAGSIYDVLTEVCLSSSSGQNKVLPGAPPARHDQWEQQQQQQYVHASWHEDARYDYTTYSQQQQQQHEPVQYCEQQHSQIHQQMHQRQFAGQSQQQQQDSAVLLPTSTAAACLLQLSISQVSVQLLAALLESGCFSSQLPWLQQQLQQQIWAVAQQQQPRVLEVCSRGGGAAATAAGVQLRTLLSRAGGLQAVSGVEVLEGVAIGLLRPCAVQMLMTGTRHITTCSEILNALQQQQH